MVLDLKCQDSTVQENLHLSFIVVFMAGQVWFVIEGSLHCKT